MARTCTVCAHPERAAIDVALLAQRPLRDIAIQFNTSKDALSRHLSHLAAALRTRDEDSLENAALAKQLELIRLDELFHAYWPGAVAGKARAATIILRIMERRARLEGLDAPTTVRHSSDRKRPIRVPGRFTVAKNPLDLLNAASTLEAAGVVPIGTESALHGAIAALYPDFSPPVTGEPRCIEADIAG